MSSDGTTTWTIDPSHSLVEFTARHMMITRVKGRFSGVSGTVVTNDAEPSNSSVNVAIAAASIDTREEKRDGHLRSGDFLDVENHPHLTFRSTRIEGNPGSAGDSFTVVGDLTIRGTTREVILDATFDGSGTDPWGAPGPASAPRRKSTAGSSGSRGTRPWRRAVCWLGTR